VSRESAPFPLGLRPSFLHLSVAVFGAILQQMSNLFYRWHMNLLPVPSEDKA
jgi:hypothetical protein